MYKIGDPLPVPTQYQQRRNLELGCRPVEQLDNKKIISLLTEIRDLLKSITYGGTIMTAEVKTNQGENNV